MSDETRDALTPVVRAWRTGQEELLNSLVHEALEARDRWAAATDKTNHAAMRDFWQEFASHLGIHQPLPYPDNAAWDQPYWDDYATSVRTERGPNQ